jgi:hypothetical protein
MIVDHFKAYRNPSIVSGSLEEKELILRFESEVWL